MEARHKVKFKLNDADIRALSDAELARERDLALGVLTPRQHALVLGVAEGKPAAQAARDARLSVKPAATASMLRTPAVAKALRLLREEARRASRLTLERAVEWFEGLAAEARKARRYGDAARAMEQAAKLLALYPEARLKLSVEQQQVDPATITAEEWELLARLEHGVRRQLGPVVEAEVIPLSEADVTSASTSESPADAQARAVPARALSTEERDASDAG